MSDPVSSAAPPSRDDADGPGLPLLKTWPAVYTLVLSVFALVVLLLTLFTLYFTRTPS